MLNKSRVHQVQDCFIVHILPNCPGNFFQLFKTNMACFILFIKGENSFQAIFGAILTDSGANTVNKLIEIDWFILFSDGPDNIFDKRASFVQFELFKYFIDFNWVDLPASILIKN